MGIIEEINKEREETNEYITEIIKSNEKVKEYKIDNINLRLKYYIGDDDFDIIKDILNDLAENVTEEKIIAALKVAKKEEDDRDEEIIATLAEGKTEKRKKEIIASIKALREVEDDENDIDIMCYYPKIENSKKAEFLAKEVGLDRHKLKLFLTPVCSLPAGVYLLGTIATVNGDKENIFVNIDWDKIYQIFDIYFVTSQLDILRKLAKVI